MRTAPRTRRLPRGWKVRPPPRPDRSSGAGSDTCVEVDGGDSLSGTRRRRSHLRTLRRGSILLPDILGRVPLWRHWHWAGLPNDRWGELEDREALLAVDFTADSSTTKDDEMEVI